MAESTEEYASLGLEDEGSMASKLARMETGETPPVKSEEELEAARLEAETKEAETLAAEAAAVAAAETAAAETAAAEAEAAEKAALEPPKPKYASIEEAEKGATEATREMHTAKEEASRERKAREALEVETETTKKELADLKAAQEVQAAVAEAAKSRPKLKEKYAEALKKIQDIPLSRDPETGDVVYPADYDDQVADAWAGTGVDPEAIAREAAKIAREELRQEQAAEGAKTKEEKDAAARKEIRGDAEKMASGAGLDMTPGSADYRLFYTFVDELVDNPEHEYKEKPFEEQIKWAAGEVRKSLGKKIELTDAEREAARKVQEKNAILQRGVSRQVLPEKPKQRTMQEILGQAV